MVQEVLIGLIFSGALGYVGHMGYRQFFANKNAGCAKGCGGCGTIDIKKIEQQIAAANTPKKA